MGLLWAPSTTCSKDVAQDANIWRKRWPKTEDQWPTKPPTSTNAMSTEWPHPAIVFATKKTQLDFAGEGPRKVGAKTIDIADILGHTIVRSTKSRPSARRCAELRCAACECRAHQVIQNPLLKHDH